MRRTIPVILSFFLFHCSYGQELDTYQNDSIYALNKISLTTMYSVQGKEKQKELVTYYNSRGQKTKQYWYWNGEEKFHNVETYLYSKNGMLTSLIDSFADGNIKKTNYVYENSVLKWRVTLNQKKDTCDFRFYPNENTTIKRWYMDGKPYRYDTTVFEKENVKLEYYGIDYSDGAEWHYKFWNQFDLKGNLIRVESLPISITTYNYDSRNLLVKKQERFKFSRKQRIKMEYYFEYQ
jgi:hypothetical protein